MGLSPSTEPRTPEETSQYWSPPPDWKVSSENAGTGFIVTLKMETGKIVGQAIFYKENLQHPERYNLSSATVWKERVDIKEKAGYRNHGIATWLLRQGDLDPHIAQSGIPRMFQDLEGKGFLRYKLLASKVLYDSGNVCIFYP